MLFVCLRGLEKQPVSATPEIGREELFSEISPEDTPCGATVAHILLDLNKQAMAVPVGHDDVVHRGGGFNLHLNYYVGILAGYEIAEAAEIKSRHRVLIENSGLG
jgi:hypothetical protein